MPPKNQKSFKDEFIDAEYFGFIPDNQQNKIIEHFQDWQKKEPPVSVPPCVDHEIKYRRSNSSSGIAPSDGLLLMQVFQDLNLNARTDRSDEEGYWQDGEFYAWMQSSKNYPIFFKAVTEGYTVESLTRYYLKHIDMSKKYNNPTNVLAYGHDGIIDGHKPFLFGVYPDNDRSIQFSQDDIDKMNIGSYEKIKVQ